MKLIEVTTPARQKDFIEMAVRLYQNGASSKKWLLKNPFRQRLNFNISWGLKLKMPIEFDGHL